MRIVLLIGLGSFVGGIFRYLLSELIRTKTLTQFPFGTLTVNLIGCFLIGIVYGLSARSGISNEWRLFLATGILGGFTTFSAFSYETVALLREGQMATAMMYIGCSICFGILATFSGLWISYGQ